jgi:hypothetical protein
MSESIVLVDQLKVMKQTPHVKVDTLKGYDRRENDSCPETCCPLAATCSAPR